MGELGWHLLSTLVVLLWPHRSRPTNIPVQRDAKNVAKVADLRNITRRALPNMTPAPDDADKPRDHLVFFVNGVKKVVRDAQPQTTLLQYLRAAGLTG